MGTKTKVLSKKKGLKSSNLLKKNKMADNKIKSSKIVSKANMKQENKKENMGKNQAGKKIKEMEPTNEKSVTDTKAGSTENNPKKQEIKQVSVEKKKAGGKAEEKELTKEKDDFNEENTVIKTTGIPIKKKKKVVKTGQKRRTRNAPSTRSLNIKEDNKLQGVSKKIKTAKVSSSNITKGEITSNKDTKVKSDSTPDIKNQPETVVDKDPKKKEISRIDKPVELSKDDKKETNKKKSQNSKEPKSTVALKELNKSNKKLKSSNAAIESLGIKENKTVESAKPTLTKGIDRNEGKGKQAKKTDSLKNIANKTEPDDSNIQKTVKPSKQECKEKLETNKTSLVKQKEEKTAKQDTVAGKSSQKKEEKTETTKKSLNKNTEKEPEDENVADKAEKVIKKSTLKKLNKTGVKRRTRLAPNTRSINTAGVGGSVTKKVKKVKPVALKEKNTHSDTEDEETSTHEREPKSKKIKLGSKETLNKTAGEPKVEKKKLNDRETTKDDEPIIKHIKVDEDISFDISSLTPKVSKKKLVGKKSEIKPKVSKKSGASLKTKVGIDKVKKKIRKDKSRRTRMSGSNTRSTSIQL